MPKSDQKSLRSIGGIIREREKEIIRTHKKMIIRENTESFYVCTSLSSDCSTHWFHSYLGTTKGDPV